MAITVDVAYKSLNKFTEVLCGDKVELLKTEPASYSWPEDAGTELLVPHPYDRLYHLYVIAMIDLYNRETDLYTNDMAVFNSAMQEYRSYYRRTNRPAADGNWFKTM